MPAFRSRRRLGSSTARRAGQAAARAAGPLVRGGWETCARQRGRAPAWAEPRARRRRRPTTDHLRSEHDEPVRRPARVGRGRARDAHVVDTLADLTRPAHTTPAAAAGATSTAAPPARPRRPPGPAADDLAAAEPGPMPDDVLAGSGPPTRCCHQARADREPAATDHALTSSPYREPRSPRWRGPAAAARANPARTAALADRGRGRGGRRVLGVGAVVVPGLTRHRLASTARAPPTAAGAQRGRGRPARYALGQRYTAASVATPPASQIATGGPAPADAGAPPGAGPPGPTRRAGGDPGTRWPTSGLSARRVGRVRRVLAGGRDPDRGRSGPVRGQPAARCAAYPGDRPSVDAWAVGPKVRENGDAQCLLRRWPAERAGRSMGSCAPRLTFWPRSAVLTYDERAVSDVAT